MEKQKPKKGLGRGLGALFTEVDDKTSVKTLVNQESSPLGNVVSLKIIDVEPNPDQPRRNFDKDALNALSESIKSHGVVSPILVQKGEIVDVSPCLKHKNCLVGGIVGILLCTQLSFQIGGAVVAVGKDAHTSLIGVVALLHNEKLLKLLV